MRILLTNDDGIGAEGLACLEAIAGELSDEVYVVAPETEQSGKGHAVSLHTPLRLRRRGRCRFSTDGTPADCAIMGIRHVMAAGGVDLLLSGVNRGANLADDITYSGTVAAAMEGTLLGVPSIALSQEYPPHGDFRWEAARHFGAGVVARLLETGWPAGVLVNVNFPPVAAGEVAGVACCRQGRHDFSALRPERRTDPFGRDYFWAGGWGMDARVRQGHEGTDIQALQDNRIAVTPLALDMTHDATLQRLAGAFP